MNRKGIIRDKPETDLFCMYEGAAFRGCGLHVLRA